MFVEFAKRSGIARGILKPVHMTRVLQSHLNGLRKPASNNLSALSEDIERTEEDQYRSFVARRALERFWAFL